MVVFFGEWGWSDLYDTLFVPLGLRNGEIGVHLCGASDFGDFRHFVEPNLDESCWLGGSLAFRRTRLMDECWLAPMVVSWTKTCTVNDFGNVVKT
eukprot:scaffold9938_cov34-Cylindrotheca_fusiformis.AAC.1